jgi:hypothetical protein
MFARMPSAPPVRWGGIGLLWALAGLPLYASCTSSEDTEPFIPAVEGAKQPAGSGPLLSEDEACDRVRAAARAAYDRLRCQAPSFPDCPSYLRPGGASGCFEYYESSVSACETTYADARSCSLLAPCIVAAERHDELATCELPETGAAGQGAGGAGGLAGAGGVGGGSGEEAPAGGAPPQAGAPAGGMAPLAGAGGA